MQMVIYIQGNGSKIKLKDMVSINMQMEQVTMANGLKTSKMVRE